VSIVTRLARRGGSAEVQQVRCSSEHGGDHGFLSLARRQRTSAPMSAPSPPPLFDVQARVLRRDRAARMGPELFLFDRAFDDCLERIALLQRRFERALLIGCPNPQWSKRLIAFVDHIEIRDPGSLFAARSAGRTIVEDSWEPEEAAYDLALAVGTLDTVNLLPLALRLIRYATRSDGLLIGAISGGDTLPQLRAAMRAVDAVTGAAVPHVHPRIEAAALAPLLAESGFVNPVVDVDRVRVSYPSLERLISDLRSMGAGNVLTARPHFIGKTARAAAIQTFAGAGDGQRTVETFEILHFAAWTPKER
jgi:hypothetical protein